MGVFSGRAELVDVLDAEDGGDVMFSSDNSLTTDVTSGSPPPCVNASLGWKLVVKLASCPLAGWASSAKAMLNKKQKQSKAFATGYPAALMVDVTWERQP